MKKLEQRVPNLRFKGFTDDWEQHKLRDVADLNGRIGFRGYTRKDIVNKDKGILAFSPTNIVSNRLIKTSKDTYITVKKYDESPEIKLKNGYVLFVKTGSTLGKSALIKELSQLATVNPQIVVIKPKRINASFMSIILLNDKVQRQVFSRKIGGAVPTLTENEINNFNFNVPKTTEQQSISEIIECLNNFLSLQQRKLDLLKQLKKGFLQKMFADKDSKQPVLRFKGFHDDWERRKLGEAAEIIGGGTPSTQISNYWNGDINWYTPAEISNFIYTRKSKRKISMEGLENSSARLLPVGTVLFTSRAGIGKTAILSKEGTTNQGFQSIVPNKKLLDSYFIFSLTNELKKYGETHGAGSTFIEISGRELAKAPLKLPALKEQKKIGGLLHQVDELISLQQQKLAKYQSIKKSLLQQMFI